MERFQGRFQNHVRFSLSITHLPKSKHLVFKPSQECGNKLDMVLHCLQCWFSKSVTTLEPSTPVQVEVSIDKVPK